MSRSSRRPQWFFLFMILFFAVLFYRLFDLQVLQGEKYRGFSQNNISRKLKLEAPRGTIYDRNGKVLAENQANMALTFTPSQAKNLAIAKKTLAYLLDLPLEKIEESLQQNAKQASHLPRVVAKNFDTNQLAKIRAKQSLLSTQTSELNLSGINLEMRYERIYPYGEATGHLLGYIREANEEDLKAAEQKISGKLMPGDLVGVNGVEKKFDESLQGQDGFREIYVDAKGREVDLQEFGFREKLQENAPISGQNLKLSIDATLSRLAYQALGKHTGSVVVIDPRNGEVLALASRPSFNSQELSNTISPDLWKRINGDPQKILLNRSLQAAYPPGSIFKIISAVAALSEGKVKPGEKISCPGYYQLGNRKWACWKKGGHGAVDLREALIHSCDVFFYHLGERLGPDVLAKYAGYFGLGEKTDILQDSERSGLVPTPDWKLKNRDEEWKASDNLSNGIGQGYNLWTPIQAARMIAEFGNGGKKLTLSLLHSDDAQSQDLPELPLALNVSQWKYLRDALTKVVEIGTGKNAKVEGISIAGKTGTAQVIELSKQGTPGISTGDHAWFVAYAPTENPSIAIAVVVEHGGGGGAVAAPIAQQVLEAYFANSPKPKTKPH